MSDYTPHEIYKIQVWHNHGMKISELERAIAQDLGYKKINLLCMDGCDHTFRVKGEKKLRIYCLTQGKEVKEYCYKKKPDLSRIVEQSD